MDQRHLVILSHCGPDDYDRGRKSALKVKQRAIPVDRQNGSFAEDGEPIPGRPKQPIETSRSVFVADLMPDRPITKGVIFPNLRRGGNVLPVFRIGPGP